MNRDTAPSPTSVTDPLAVAHDWVLVELGNSAALEPALTDHCATLVFDTHQVTGSTGCNEYGAD